MKQIYNFCKKEFFVLLRWLKNAAKKFKNFGGFLFENLIINIRQFKLRKLHKNGSYLPALCRLAEKECLQMKNDDVLGSYFLNNNPWIRHRWKDFNYWNGWYAISKIKKPINILEIGTAFGFSAIALARGAEKNLKLLVSLDLGNFGKLFINSFPEMDNLLYIKEGINQFKKENRLDFDYLQFEVNTQPPPCTDNEGNFVSCPYWRDNRYLVDLLQKTRFDIILIDGKHTDDALYNDLLSFFDYGAKDCLIICDDLQHKDVIRSFSRFIDNHKGDILDYSIWRYLTCDGKYGGTFRRDQGLIVKGSSWK